MKEKVEEILYRFLTQKQIREDGIVEIDFKETIEELSTLIQAERKEAVEVFVYNIGWKKPSEVIDLADDVIDGRSLVKQMETYLQSLDKGEQGV